MIKATGSCVIAGCDKDGRAIRPIHMGQAGEQRSVAEPV